MAQLGGNVALITGGSTGIGRATAFALAKENATLVLVARRLDRLERTRRELERLGASVLSIPVDVTKESDVAELFQQVDEQLGPIDILINNAGSGVFAPIAESSIADWHQTVAVNLTGTYLCTRYALSRMLPRQAGTIVNVLSIAAKIAFKGAAAYCAAKAGALAFTRVLAEEVRDQGIRVTAICPGSVASPFWEAIEPKPDLEQMQRPEDIAEVIRFAVCQPSQIVIDEIVTTPPLGIL